MSFPLLFSQQRNKTTNKIFEKKKLNENSINKSTNHSFIINHPFNAIFQKIYQTFFQNKSHPNQIMFS